MLRAGLIGRWPMLQRCSQGSRVGEPQSLRMRYTMTGEQRIAWCPSCSVENRGPMKIILAALFAIAVLLVLRAMLGRTRS